MSITEKKLTIFEFLATTKNTKMIDFIYNQIISRKVEKDVDFWDEFSDEQKAEIEESIAEADRGELIPHEEVMKKYKKWL